jgi:hypothetical protein
VSKIHHCRNRKVGESHQIRRHKAGMTKVS